MMLNLVNEFQKTSNLKQQMLTAQANNQISQERMLPNIFDVK